MDDKFKSPSTFLSFNKPKPDGQSAFGVSVYQSFGEIGARKKRIA